MGRTPPRGLYPFALCQQQPTQTGVSCPDTQSPTPRSNLPYETGIRLSEIQHEAETSESSRGKAADKTPNNRTVTDKVDPPLT